MDYYRILNFKREPFSNSPEPDFFYPASKHEGCLQKLELAIRLRRGLNVVIGEVGTGKTTLCRQLILKMGISVEDREQIECHLILDPSFSTAHQFLKTVATMFGVADTEAEEDEWQLKEKIKNYLFEKGVQQGRIVVLIVDEGQKIPDFCIELMREFLNYETNEYKLLQIVLFAQKEFQSFLKGHKNFADRVNQYYFLEPLNFAETKRMIDFRLAKASDANTPPDFFTSGALYAIYRRTGGYPRKINTLCHQLILSLIIQNRAKADWFLVQSVAGRVSIERPRRIGWAVAAGSAGLLIVVGAFALGPYRGQLTPASLLPRSSQPMASRPAITPAPPTQTASATPAPAPSPAGAPAAVKEQEKPLPPAPGEKKAPKILGKINIKKGGTLWWMFSDVYGTFDINRFRLFARANPHIKDVNNVKGGELISFPALAIESESAPAGTYWVKVMQAQTLDEAYRFLKDGQQMAPSLRLFLYWNGSEGMVYAVFMRDVFMDPASALNAANQLPPAFAGGAKIVTKWDKDTVFFSGKR